MLIIIYGGIININIQFFTFSEVGLSFQATHRPTVHQLINKHVLQKDVKSDVGVIPAEWIEQGVVQIVWIARVAIQGRQIVRRPEQTIAVRVASPPLVRRVLATNSDQLCLELHLSASS